MARLYAIFVAARPLSCILAGSAVLLGGFLAGGVNTHVVLASLMTTSVTGMGFLVNDYADWEIDQKKKRRVRPKERRDLALAGLATLLVSSVSLFALPSTTVILGLANIIILFIYNGKLGAKSGFIGNLEVGYLSASTLLVGATAYGSANLRVVMLASVTFVMIVARKITKDIEDVDVDRGYRLTLPMQIGERASCLVANGFLAVGIAMSIMFGALQGSRVLLFYLPSTLTFALAFKYTPLRIQGYKNLVYLGLSIGIVSNAMLGLLS